MHEKLQAWVLSLVVKTLANRCHLSSRVISCHLVTHLDQDGGGHGVGPVTLTKGSSVREARDLITALGRYGTEL